MVWIIFLGTGGKLKYMGQGRIKFINLPLRQVGDILEFYYIIRTFYPQVKVSTINGIHWRARLFFFTQMRTMGTESPLRFDIFGSSSAKAISSILNS